MSEDKPRRRIITAGDISEERDRKRKIAKRRYEQQRKRKIDGWNHNRRNQTLTINRPIQVVSRTGMHTGGARVFTCPRCNGKKQIRKVVPPQQGLPTNTAKVPCNTCAGKGYIWI